jgi:hypothetical protein
VHPLFERLNLVRIAAQPDPLRRML